ncbi:hypothetical protein WA026_009098 [Henosepilachna vigintioctopunctata]|uniref:Cuticle protein n=1 Tax=Henosepilachna vigintioctopunctata TaxID=420089 RepID=A0AAW1UWK7_9CUCU
MAFKFIVFAAVLAYANAGNIIAAPLAAAPLAYAAPAVAKLAVAQPEPYDPRPQYQFGYDVQDSLTGDSKSQVEQRDGDVVQGSYSLNEPDGTRRTVDYTADPIHGFNAVVRKEPLVAKAVVAAPAIAKVHAPIVAQPLLRSYAAPAIAAAPLIRSYAAPAIHAAPLVQSYAAPAIAAAPLLRSYAAPAIHAAPLLRSAPIYSSGYAPALGYSAYGRIASPLGFSTLLH